MTEPLQLRRPTLWMSRQVCRHFLVTGRVAPIYWYYPTGYDPDDYAPGSSPREVFCRDLSQLAKRYIGGGSGEKCATAVKRACLGKRVRK